MRLKALVLAVTIATAPLGAQAADLVVWWDKGYYTQDDEAVREIIAAFEQRPASRSNAGQFGHFDVPSRRSRPAVRFPIGLGATTDHADQCAYENARIDLTDAVRHSWTCSIAVSKSIWPKPRTNPRRLKRRYG